MCAQCNNVTNKWHHCVGDVAEDALVLGENAMTKSTPNYRVLPQTQSVTGCCCWWENVTSLYCHYVIFGNGNPTTGQLTSSGEKCKELRDPPPPTGEWHPYYWLSSKCLCFMDIPLKDYLINVGKQGLFSCHSIVRQREMDGNGRQDWCHYVTSSVIQK